MARYSDIPAARESEYLALLELLASHAARGASGEDPALSERIARAALEPGHLWVAMDLGNRAELQEIFEVNYPELAAGNTQGMRWKKYLYKRICGWPGFEA
jgi:nitrogen fixation protein NifQ